MCWTVVLSLNLVTYSKSFKMNSVLPNLKYIDSSISLSQNTRLSIFPVKLEYPTLNLLKGNSHQKQIYYLYIDSYKMYWGSCAFLKPN